jgi:hypothetical protein
VDNWLVALIAAAGAVSGAAVSGVVAYRLARLDRESRDADELRAALAAYGAALDRLSLKIEQLPQSHGIEEDWTTRLLAPWRTLDWLMGRLSLVTLGRGGMIAVDEVIAATNRLLLVAPRPVLEEMERVSDLLGRLDPPAKGWQDEFREARAAFAGTARAAVVGSGRHLRSVPAAMKPVAEDRAVLVADRPGGSRLGGG